MQRQQVDLPILNEVRLTGRISGDPMVRELPSGTVLVSFRLVVKRAPTAMTRGSRAQSDWIGCAAWGGRVRAQAATWQDGDWVEVSGSLRRRFSRDEGRASSLEVEVLSGRRLQRATGHRTESSNGLP